MAGAEAELEQAAHPRKILFLVTEDWYFASHRADLARLVAEAGYEVVVGTRINKNTREISENGVRMMHIPFVRSLRSPWHDLVAVRAISRLIENENPDIVHLVSLKPILLGGLVLTRYPHIRAIAAFTGLGYIFSSGARLALVLKPLVVALLRGLMQRPNFWMIVQNKDDLSLLQSEGIGRAGRHCIVRGAGVDIDKFVPFCGKQTDPPMILFCARVLADKGAREFVGAARILVQEGCNARFVIAGADDRDNPGAIPRHEIESWIEEGLVEWHGHCDRMPELYRDASILCLPSYREGLPKVLLEAAASGVPLISTDVPGCREICINGETGLLVPPRDSAAIAGAIRSLLANAALAHKLGNNARKLVAAEFSVKHVSNQTIALYREIMATDDGLT